MRRIDQTIAEIASQPALERQRKLCLLQALENEKEEMIRCNPSLRLATRLRAA